MARRMNFKEEMPFMKHAELWLGVAVEDKGEFPLIKLTSVGYALHAKYADLLTTPPTSLSCTGCINGEHVENGALTGLHLLDGSVEGADLKQGSVGLASFSGEGCKLGMVAEFNGKTWACAVDDQGVTGSGSVGTLAMFTGAGQLGDSIITNKGAMIGVGTADPKTTLHVAGGATFEGEVDFKLKQAKQFRVQVGAAPAACAAATIGLVYYDITEKKLMLCDGTAYRALAYYSYKGKTQDEPGLHCDDIQDYDPSLESGVYWIDPDGGATSNAFQVYCDMTTDGGGWTLIYKKSAGVGSKPSDDFYSGNLNAGDATLMNKDKVSKDYANKIITTHWSKFSEARVELLVGGVAKKYLHYTITGTDKTNWYNQAHLISSSWTDIKSETKNYWSVVGDGVSGYRDFFINRNYNGCAADAGWVVVEGSGTPSCSWNIDNTPRFATPNTYQNWTTGSITNADAFLIMVR